MGDQAQAANNALAAISANLHPGNWEKSEDADENLRSFNEWLEKYRRWTNICVRGINMDDSMKWDMLVATAGTDLHDVMKEAGIITERREARDEQQFRPYRARVPAVPGAGPGDPNIADEIPEQAELPYLPAVTASVPTQWHNGIEMIRTTIKKYGNQISQRHHLMTGIIIRLVESVGTAPQGAVKTLRLGSRIHMGDRSSGRAIVPMSGRGLESQNIEDPTMDIPGGPRLWHPARYFQEAKPGFVWRDQERQKGGTAGRSSRRQIRGIHIRLQEVHEAPRLRQLPGIQVKMQ